MNRIQTIFRNKPIFMPYFPVGFPNFAVSLDVLEALAKNGADLLEVGLSFSDPLADGPVIQHATQIALEQGFSTQQAIQAVAELRRRGVTIPLLLMGYYNPILSYGLEKFVRAAQRAGADGFILPDLPPEESDEFQQALQAAADGKPPLPQISMLAPTTPAKRMEEVVSQAQGFLYLVSVTGVTGARASLADDLSGLVERVRQQTTLPVCVGFGISSPQQAQAVAALADGVIVGSACIRTVEASSNPAQAAAEFARAFGDAVHSQR